MGNKRLMQLQIGQEATPGTAVVPTARWRGPVVAIDDQRIIVFPDEDIGSIPGKDRSYIPALKGMVAIPDTEATFEQIAYPLISGVEDPARVQDGAGDGYITQHDFPTDTQYTVSDIKSLSITSGDDQAKKQVEYFFTTEFTLHGVVNEALKLEGWKGEGRKLETDAFETISLPSVEEILVNKSTMAIDAVGGTLGATVITDIIREISLKVVTGWIGRASADGQLYINKCVMTKPVITFEVIFDHDTTAIAERANWENEVARQIQVKFEGSDFGTAGTVYSKKTHIWNIAGKWEYFEPLGEQDLITVSKGIFKVLENDTASLYAQIINVVDLVTLP